MLKKLIRFPIQLFLFVIFLSSLLLAFAQFQFVKDWMRDLLLSNLKNRLNADIFIGQIGGNLITQFEVIGIVVKMEDEYIIKAEKATVKVNPFSLFSNNLQINEFIINSPEINIHKIADSSWNYENIVKKSKSSNDSTHNFLNLLGIEIKDGILNFDSRPNLEKQTSSDKHFNFDHFSLTELNLALSFETTSIFTKIDIGHLSFVKDSKYNLKDLSGIFFISQDESRIDSLNLEYNNSSLQLDAFIKGVDLRNESFSLDILKSKPLGISLDVLNLNLNDLGVLIPSLSFLNENIKLKLEANGNLEDLYIKSLNCRTKYSDLQISGNLKNLHQPKDLYIKSDITNSSVTAEDINTYLPGLNLPNLKELGKYNVNIQYEGKPANFKSKIKIEGLSGIIEGEVSLNFEPNIPSYMLELYTHNIDLKSVLGSEFNTNINCIAKAKGSGFRIEDISSEFDFIIDSSYFNNQSIDKSKLTVMIKNKHINSLFALRGGNTQIGLNTEVDFNKNSNQFYIFNLSLQNLDLLKFTNKVKYSTNINLMTNIQGSRLNIDNTSGKIRFVLFPSKVGNNSIGNTNFFLNYDQDNYSNKIISLRSDVLDFDLKGIFNIATIAPILTDKLSPIQSDFHRLLIFPQRTDINNSGSFETINPFNLSKILKREIKESNDSLDFRYDLIIKDISSFKNFIELKDIGLDVKCSGQLIANKNHLRTNGIINIDNCIYLSGKQDLLIQDVFCNFNVSIENGNSPLLNINSEIDISAATIFFGKLSLNNSKLSLKTTKNNTTFLINSSIDSSSTANISGSLNFSDTLHTLIIDKIIFGYNHYNWNNKDKIVCLIKSDGFEIESFEIFHENEKIYLQGNINKSGEQNLNLIVEKLLIQNVISIFSRNLSVENSLIKGELNFTCEVFGTASDPLINVFLDADSITMNNKYMGKLFGKMHYEEQVLYNNIQFKSSTSGSSKKSDLLVIGTIPINLTFGNSDKLFPDDEDIDLFLVTDHLPMDLLSVIVPELERFEGTSDANIHFYGSGDNPYMEGYFLLNKSTFTLKQNNIRYLTYGQVFIEEEDIKLNLSIENLKSDNKDGKIDLSGNILTENLKLLNINAIVHGKLQVLQDKSSKSHGKLSGDLFLVIGENGVKYNNDFIPNKNAQLTGTIILSEGNLIFPSSNGNSYYDVNSSDFSYTIIDDTSAIIIDSAKIKKRLMQNQFKKQFDISNESEKSSSSFSNLDYNIEIKTLGNLKVTMTFNSILNEELVGELGGNIALIKEKNSNGLYGSLLIGDKSFYKFAGKKFDATGKIIFTGVFDNPELDIKAYYEGTHINREISSSTKEEKVLITLNLTGTKEKPNLKFDLLVDGKPRKQSEIESDVFAFILSGSFNDELTSDQKQNIALNYNFESSFFSIGSGVISGKLTNFFRNEFEFIKSAEIDYKGGDITRTNVQISGEIGKTAVFHLGGRVFDDVSNTNVAFEIPIGKLTNNESLRNLILEVYRTTENTKTYENKETPFYGSRILYRINF